MPTVEFYHKQAPAVNTSAGVATIAIYAAQIEPDAVVILDDEDGDTHDVPANLSETGAIAQARAGTIARIVDIAGRRGLSLSTGNVTDVTPPDGG